MQKKTATKKETLGDRIKQLRREREWSQEDLGKKINSHLHTINRYEKGESFPTADILQTLAEVFGVSADYLLFGESEDGSLLKVKNKELLKRFQLLDRINADNMDGLLQVMDLYIRDQQAKEVFSN